MGLEVVAEFRSFGVEGEGTLGRVLGAGLCGTRPARAGKLAGGWAFRAVREGVDLIASSACFGLIPLRCIFWLCGTVPALGLGFWPRGQSHLFTQKVPPKTVVVSFGGLRWNGPATARGDRLGGTGRSRV